MEKINQFFLINDGQMARSEHLGFAEGSGTFFKEEKKNFFKKSVNANRLTKIKR
jgi:hypothetical protein